MTIGNNNISIAFALSANPLEFNDTDGDKLFDYGTEQITYGKTILDQQSSKDFIDVLGLVVSGKKEFAPVNIANALYTNLGQQAIQILAYELGHVKSLGVVTHEDLAYAGTSGFGNESVALMKKPSSEVVEFLHTHPVFYPLGYICTGEDRFKTCPTKTPILGNLTVFTPMPFPLNNNSAAVQLGGVDILSGLDVVMFGYDKEVSCGIQVFGKKGSKGLFDKLYFKGLELYSSYKYKQACKP